MTVLLQLFLLAFIGNLIIVSVMGAIFLNLGLIPVPPELQWLRKFILLKRGTEAWGVVHPVEGGIHWVLDVEYSVPIPFIISDDITQTMTHKVPIGPLADYFAEEATEAIAVVGQTSSSPEMLRTQSVSSM